VDALITTEEDTSVVFRSRPRARPTRGVFTEVSAASYKEGGAAAREKIPFQGGGHHPAREPAGVAQYLDRARYAEGSSTTT